MSVEVFLRNPDGTTWEGRIMYNFTAKREDDFKLKFEENTLPSIEEIYQTYGESPAFKIGPALFADVGNLALVYRFLYGYTLNELMETDESKSIGRYPSWLNQPQEWTKPLALSMDWDLFCLTYYTLLCTNNGFKSKVWDAFISVLKILKQDEKVLPAILLQYDREYDTAACESFWEAIYKGLTIKTLGWLQEHTCYKAYEALTQIQDILPADKYQVLERECCEFWDSVAKKRIDEETAKTHTVKELVDFNIDRYFFYEEFFALKSTSEGTKAYVMNTTCTFLHTIGDKVFAAGEALGADTVYETALKFAQTEEDQAIIMQKRHRISSYVAEAKNAKEKERLANEKKRQKERRKDDFAKVAARVIVIAVAICILLLIIFGVMALLGVFVTLAKTILKIAGFAIVAFIVFMIIMSVADKK